MNHYFLIDDAQNIAFIYRYMQTTKKWTDPKSKYLNKNGGHCPPYRE
jgi:hypothetical protein